MKEILFILDEAGQIGPMPAIEQGLTLLRSYGLRMAFFFQSLGQLKAVFRDKESVLLDNTEQVYFGVYSYETADRVSKMLGEATITVENAGASVSRSHQAGGTDHSGGGVNVSRSDNRGWAVQARPLLKPEEVLQLGGDNLIAFLRDLPPIKARRVKWYEDPAFNPAVRRCVPLLWWALLAAAAGLIVWALTGC